MKMNRRTFKDYSNKFQFISNMQSTSTSKQWFFGLCCTLLLLCASALPSAGQTVRTRVERLHQVALCSPTWTATSPGEVTIRYSNNVVGVDEVHYQFRDSGTSGPWFHEVDAAAPGSTVKAEIPTSMSGKSLFVRVTTKCGTDTRSNVWNMGNIIAQKTETITLQGSSTDRPVAVRGRVVVSPCGSMAPRESQRPPSSSTSGTALRCWPANAARARMRG